MFCPPISHAVSQPTISASHGSEGRGTTTSTAATGPSDLTSPLTSARHHVTFSNMQQTASNTGATSIRITRNGFSHQAPNSATRYQPANQATPLLNPSLPWASGWRRAEASTE